MMILTRENVREKVKNHISGKSGVAHVRHAYDYGLFSPYAWPGGYPIIFLDSHNNIFCADCAKKIFIEEHENIHMGTYDEGPTIQCDECNCEIESAYGDPENPGED